MKLVEIRKLGYAVVAASLLAASGGALAQGVKNSINLSVAALPPLGDVKASVAMLEYERLVSPRISVFGRGSSLKYKFDDDNYVEDGDGTGFGVGMRFYPQRGLKGFYIGAVVSAFDSDWTWTEKSPVGSGKGTTKSIQWGGELGYRINLGSERVSLTPGLNFGSWLGGDDTCSNTNGTPCSKESELGFYVVVSLALGIAF